MRYIAVQLIRLYQLTLSPDHGLLKARYPHGFCKFYPSCSEYAKEAIMQKGVMRGSVLAALRVLKCNPWSEPRVDRIKITNS